jgi:WD40 repeat protein
LQTTLTGHTDTVTGVAIDPKLRYLVSSSLDGNVILWNLKSDRRSFRFVGHRVRRNDATSTHVAVDVNFLGSYHESFFITQWGSHCFIRKRSHYPIMDNQYVRVL